MGDLRTPSFIYNCAPVNYKTDEIRTWTCVCGIELDSPDKKCLRCGRKYEPLVHISHTLKRMEADIFSGAKYYGEFDFPCPKDDCRWSIKKRKDPRILPRIIGFPTGVGTTHAFLCSICRHEWTQEYRKLTCVDKIQKMFSKDTPVVQDWEKNPMLKKGE